MKNKNKKQTILKILDALEKEVRQYDELNISLMEGTPGIILFLDYYSSVCFKSSVVEYKEELLAALIAEVNKKADSFSLTYCDGLVGFLSFIRFLEVKNNQKYFDDDDLDLFLFEVMCENLAKGKFDFLHGPLGIFWYFVIRVRSETDRKKKFLLLDFLKKGITLLEESAIKNDFSYSWKDAQNLNKEFQNKDVYNLGFAHGQPGILAILSHVFSFFPRNENLERMIRGSANFILSQRRTRFSSQFQSYFSPQHDFPFDSRLAWCYGDLSISIALYFASDILKDTELKSQALAIAQQTTKRRSVAETSVFDGEFCHGSVGLEHMYGLLYRRTGNKVFYNSQNYWLDNAIAQFDDDMLGYRTYIKEGAWGKDAGLLKGISGIGLSFTSYLTGSNEWNSFLLLS